MELATERFRAFSIEWKQKQQRGRYREFVGQEDSAETSRVFEKKKLPPNLGSEGFIDPIQSQFFDSKQHIEVPE